MSPPTPIEQAQEAEDRMAAAFELVDGPGYAWELVRRGARAYLREPASLAELIEELELQHDYLLEALGFEQLGDSFYVGLLDEAEPCDRFALLQALRRVQVLVTERSR